MGFEFPHLKTTETQAAPAVCNRPKPKIPDQNRYQALKTTSCSGRDTPNMPYMGKTLARQPVIQ